MINNNELNMQPNFNLSSCLAEHPFLTYFSNVSIKNNKLQIKQNYENNLFFKVNCYTNSMGQTSTVIQLEDLLSKEISNIYIDDMDIEMVN